MEIEIDEEKVDEAVLALLYLTTFKDKPYWRAWKGHNWDSLDRLHQKGYISDPATKAKSVVLTEEGAKRSQDLFKKYFTKIDVGSIVSLQRIVATVPYRLVRVLSEMADFFK
jgi:hypothetical protein